MQKSQISAPILFFFSKTSLQIRQNRVYCYGRYIQGDEREEPKQRTKRASSNGLRGDVSRGLLAAVHP